MKVWVNSFLGENNTDLFMGFLFLGDFNYSSFGDLSSAGCAFMMQKQFYIILLGDLFFIRYLFAGQAAAN